MSCLRALPCAVQLAQPPTASHLWRTRNAARPELASKRALAFRVEQAFTSAVSLRPHRSSTAGSKASPVDLVNAPASPVLPGSVWRSHKLAENSSQTPIDPVLPQKGLVRFCASDAFAVGIPIQASACPLLGSGSTILNRVRSQKCEAIAQDTLVVPCYSMHAIHCYPLYR